VTSSREYAIELDATPDAVPLARQALADVEPALPPELVRDLHLLTSELVTNSVRHGKLGPEARVLVTVRLTSDVVRVEVSDPGPGFEPAGASTPTLYQQSGWGLYLVDQLATRWGVDRARRTSVWFEIARPPAEGSVASV
jgi:anti-sigma regulatory factor (Ser/Thr protein kinase)